MVEYLIVTLMTLALVAALSTISNRLREGIFVDHAADSASHSVGAQNISGVIGDVFLY